ncbi:MAG: MarR family winged helix-turn-helix transcriptional regulator [Bacteriovoracaceae bacterium]|jgi:DNA-binding MarR family transcriptional regulator
MDTWKLLDLLCRCSIAIKSTFGKQSHLITFSEYKFLSLIDQGMNCSTMSKNLGISSAAVSKKISLLANKGFIHRDTPADKRAVKIRITAQGKKAHTRMQKNFEDKFNTAFEMLSPEERQNLERGLFVLEKLITLLSP